MRLLLNNGLVDTMDDNKELLTFPCDFPIKVIGEVTAAFEPDVLAIARRHHPELKATSVTTKPSAGGKYLAITIIVHADSQDMLDALYEELSKHPDAKMVL